MKLNNRPPLANTKSNPQTQRALPFIIGCPACQHNFIHLWCVLTCSPDQAAFTNVTAVVPAADNNATAVAEIDVWLDEGFSGALFNSCKVRLGAC
jgi:Niemann-Pick C1 protein